EVVLTGPVDDETVGAHGTIVEGACDAPFRGSAGPQAYLSARVGISRSGIAPDPRPPEVSPMELRPRDLVNRIGKVKALDRIGAPIANAYSQVVKPGRTKDLLSGTWLGHALHPVLTDVVIGSWTSAFLLDLLGESGEDAADALIAVGIVS